MRTCLTFLITVSMVLLTLAGCSRKQEESEDQAPRSGKRQSAEEATLTKVGDQVPAFSVVTIDGGHIDGATAAGTVLVVNFFATWCPPCQRELPELQSQIWQRYKDRNLTVICIGREHSAEELLKYRQEKAFELPMAPDPNRGVYAKFATSYIPRVYVVGKDGKIKHQTVGFDPQDFTQIIEVIERELAMEAPRADPWLDEPVAH